MKYRKVSSLLSALRIIEHEQSLNNLKDCYMSLLQEITSVA